MDVESREALCIQDLLCLTGRVVPLLLALTGAAAAQGLTLNLGSAQIYPRIDLAGGYQVDSSWPRRPEGMAWGEMPGVCVDQHDQVWTFNRGETPVQVYGPDGQFVRAWGRGQVGKAHHVRVDREGNVWLSDIGFHVIRKFTPEGGLLLTLGTPGEAARTQRISTCRPTWPSLPTARRSWPTGTATTGSFITTRTGAS